MATDKLVLTMVPSSGYGGHPIYLYVTYDITQSVEQNTSTISLSMKIVPYGSGGWPIGEWSQIDKSWLGTTDMKFNAYVPSNTTTSYTFPNSYQTLTVNHNVDGTGSATIYWHLGCRSSWAGLTDTTNRGSFTITLPTIPRSHMVNIWDDNQWKTGKLYYYDGSSWQAPAPGGDSGIYVHGSQDWWKGKLVG